MARGAWNRSFKAAPPAARASPRAGAPLLPVAARALRERPRSVVAGEAGCPAPVIGHRDERTLPRREERQVAVVADEALRGVEPAVEDHLALAGAPIEQHR